MSEQALVLVTQFGLPIMGLIVMLGCSGIPMPAAIAILAGASFAAAGEFSLGAVYITALLAAVIGDNIGFALGRRLTDTNVLDQSRLFRAVSRRARLFLARRGNWAIFLSRWLVAPLGPAINILAGHSAYSWRRFALFQIPGQIVWVALHCTLGTVFSRYILQVAELVSSITGLLAASVIIFFVGRALWRAHQGDCPALDEADHSR